MDLNDLAKNPEQLKNLITLLQGMLPQTTEDDKAEEETEEDFTAPLRTKGSRSKNTKQTKNKFVDMPERDMHKDDTIIDKKLARFPPVSRARPFELVQVRCRVCGKTEKVSPSLVFEGVDRYKCNNCSTSSG
jgi:hypothetical protein